MAKPKAKEEVADHENLIITLYVTGAGLWALAVVVMTASSVADKAGGWYTQFSPLIGALPFIFLAGGLFSLALGAHNDRKRDWVRLVLIASCALVFLAIGWVTVTSFK